MKNYTTARGEAPWDFTGIALLIEGLGLRD